RAFPSWARKRICGRDGFTPDLGRGGDENLSGAISGFTFCGLNASFASPVFHGADVSRFNLNP
ncbi:MAG TPA: hypothetical protein VKT99_20400, partial [Xanthobacteraceae bacterium]|nr:hypothetical protein [Xanthobacteraceae bacterium]